jgi:hypothetical protein
MMARSRASAKAAGASLEIRTADWLQKHVSGWIVRAAPQGTRDRGDVWNVRAHGGRPVVVECKDVVELDLSGWVREAEAERLNEPGAIAGVVVHKRRGKGDPADQYVTMTLRDFAALILGVRPE